MPYRVTDKNGKQVNEGDEIVNFRGEVATFVSVTRGTEHNGFAKVFVRGDGGFARESGAQVYDLKVQTISGWVAAQDRSVITDENVDELMEQADTGIGYWATPNGAELLGPDDQTPEWASFTIVERDTGVVFHLSRDDIRFAFLALAEHGQTLTYRRTGERFHWAWETRGEHGIETAALDPVSGDVVTQIACFGEIRH
ncbi:hypothetical protein ALI22I_33815 [Saccharothrix sp. ALI-22-I]|uniref:hypothetical protein n=1 Tax=Saccharothrix sp. ALI-22-I TaxID=1933778 RepID=UPI00097BF43C|nr:hypothetical protein [Saccharothrix sp. ALI-22-I]ONI83477.1 hypothetical protein ALI22I_33815 [Saccharothrix sp. ALI-22-I]